MCPEPSCEDITCQGMCKTLDNFYNKYLAKDMGVLKGLVQKVENLDEGQQQNRAKIERNSKQIARVENNVNQEMVSILFK